VAVAAQLLRGLDLGAAVAAPDITAHGHDPAMRDTCTSSDCAGCSSAHRAVGKLVES
jgi:hypothetical protein